MAELIFLKLGGSLITDKAGVESVREKTLARLAEEIARAKSALPALRLVLGHGSGSFGHVAAARHKTRQGVRSSADWRGFAQVSDAAARLNRIVVKELLSAGVNATTLQPSASAICVDGRIQSFSVETVELALRAELLPVVYGDVAFDTVRGGTIISTEEIMMQLAQSLRPSWFLLAGETKGVLDGQGSAIPLITSANYEEVSPFIRGSRGTDVTGGMDSKVRSMLNLVSTSPALQVRIFSGLEPGLLEQLLQEPQEPFGTHIAA
jgi:isopentenyl phosphate kinase